MKKIIFLLILIFTLSGCQDEVKFNDPAFQGLKQGILWRATSFDAKKTSNGFLVFTATKGYETITIRTDQVIPHTSQFGTNIDNFAEFVNNSIEFQNKYSTGFGEGKGEIIITDYSNGTVSGSFNFIAINTDTSINSPNAINFSKGAFYGVPVVIIP